MEPKFQTSFIPKKPIGQTGGPSLSVVHNVSIFSTVAAVVFIVTILSSGALFFYKNILSGQIGQYDKDIASASSAFQPQKIQDLIDANSRIATTKTLLENHVVVSKLLLLLNNLVLKKIRIADLIYSNKNKEPSLLMIAEAQTYNALAEQQDLFLKNEFIKDPVFSSFVLGDNGYITFNFLATINSNLISYKKAIQ